MEHRAAWRFPSRMHCSRQTPIAQAGRDSEVWALAPCALGPQPPSRAPAELGVNTLKVSDSLPTGLQNKVSGALGYFFTVGSSFKNYIWFRFYLFSPFRKVSYVTLPGREALRALAKSLLWLFLGKSKNISHTFLYFGRVYNNYKLIMPRTWLHRKEHQLLFCVVTL